MKNFIRVILAIGIGIIIGWIGGTIESNKEVNDAITYYNRYSNPGEEMNGEFFMEMIHKAIDYPLP